MTLTYDRPDQHNAVNRVDERASCTTPGSAFATTTTRSCWSSRAPARRRSAPAGTSRTRPTSTSSATTTRSARSLYNSPGECGYTRKVDVFKPVIAAVNGYAFAAGLETALLADIRIAAENAEFGALERRWNIVGGDGMTVRLPLVVGFAKAMELIITGRRIDVAGGARDRARQRGRPARPGARRARRSSRTRSRRCPRERSAATRRASCAASGARSRSGCASRPSRRCRCSCAATRTRSARAAFKRGDLQPEWPHHGLYRCERPSTRRAPPAGAGRAGPRCSGSGGGTPRRTVTRRPSRSGIPRPGSRLFRGRSGAGGVASHPAAVALCDSAPRREPNVCRALTACQPAGTFEPATSGKTARCHPLAATRQPPKGARARSHMLARMAATAVEDVLWNLEELVDGGGAEACDRLLDEADARARRVRRAPRGQRRRARRRRARRRDGRARRDLRPRRARRQLRRTCASPPTPTTRPTARSSRASTSARRRSRRSCCSSTSSGRSSTTSAPTSCSRPTGLDLVRHHLRTVRRYRPHLLSEPEEKLMAEKAVTGRDAWSRLFSELTSAIRVELPDGEERRPARRRAEPPHLAGPRDAAHRGRGGHRGARARGCARAPTSTTRCSQDKATDDRLRRYPTWISSRNLSNEASDESVQALLERRASPPTTCRSAGTA